MEKLNPKIAKRKAVKGSDFYYNPSTNEMELQSDPSPLHVSNSEKEPKLHSPSYRRKYSERYSSGYVEWYDRVDKLKEKVKQTRMSDRDTVRSHVKNIGHRKFLSKDELKYLKPEDRGSEIKLEIKAPTYFPTNERIAETLPPNFETPVDLDLFKGLGSFLGTTRKDYKE